jgi:hypothetical protein
MLLFICPKCLGRIEIVDVIVGYAAEPNKPYPTQGQVYCHTCDTTFAFSAKLEGELKN